MTEQSTGVCRCCELVDKDITLKPVKYCKVCDALICDLCRFNIIKRTKAFLKQ